jgi:hypothetical protein
MPVRFAGPAGVQELIPAPLVEIQKGLVRGPNGLVNHVEYTFTLTGTIVNIDTPKDSPNSALWPMTMEGILAEQKRIRGVFSGESGRLEIETPGGGGPNTVDAYCTVESVTFGQGTWVDRATYTVVLKARRIENENDPTQEIDSFSESWNITENEDKTFTLSHQIQARGILIYGSGGPNDPLISARDWVRSRMYSTSTTGNFNPFNFTEGFDLSILLSVLPDTHSNFWNKSVVESVDPETYSWSVTENFIYNPAGNTKDEWTASITYEADNIRKITLNLSGTIVGFSDRASNLEERLVNTKKYFTTNVEPNIYTRLSTYIPSGYTVNPAPTSRSYTYDPNGTIRYTFTFVGSTGTLIDGAIEETISINDVGSTDIFAQIQVPGRAKGPVIQPMKTISLPERTINITATLTQASGTITLTSLKSMYISKPNTDAIINALKPNVGYYYTKTNSEDWNPIRRQYSRTISWVLQAEGLPVEGVPSAVSNQAAF